MRTLLVGSTGFIGSQIKNELSGSDHNFFCLDRDQIDFLEKDSVKALSKHIDKNTQIIFCTGIKKQHGDTVINWKKNETITQNLVFALHESAPLHLLYLSSAAVYGEDTNFIDKISEHTEKKGSSFYGISKISAENALAKTGSLLGFPVSIVRPPLIYGIGDTTLGYGPTGFCNSAITGTEITVWGDGKERREFITVEDLAKICIALSTRNHDGVVNTVTGRSRTFLDLIEIIKTNGFENLKIRHKPRTKEKVHHDFDPQMLIDAIGDYNFVSQEDGIRAMLSALERG